MVSVIKRATIDELQEIESFLQKANLNTINIRNCINNFLLLRDEEHNLKATVGIDIEDSLGLIRSLAILPTVTHKEIIYLLEHVITLAEQLPINELILLARRTTNHQLFYFFQFEEVELDEEKSRMLEKNGYQFEKDVTLFRKTVNNGYKLSTI